MADGTETVEVTTEMVVEANNPATEAPEMGGEGTAAEQMARMAAALKKANAEAAAQRKKLEQLQKAEQTRAEAELSELERLRTRLADEEAKRAALELKDLQREAAEKAGLPVTLAGRLQGVTLEELEADAASLAATLPKVKTPPAINATNPGANANRGGGETDEQRRKRLFG